MASVRRAAVCWALLTGPPSWGRGGLGLATEGRAEGDRAWGYVALDSHANRVTEDYCPPHPHPPPPAPFPVFGFMSAMVSVAMTAANVLNAINNSNNNNNNNNNNGNNNNNALSDNGDDGGGDAEGGGGEALRARRGVRRKCSCHDGRRTSSEPDAFVGDARSHRDRLFLRSLTPSVMDARTGSLTLVLLVSCRALRVSLALPPPAEVAAGGAFTPLPPPVGGGTARGGGRRRHVEYQERGERAEGGGGAGGSAPPSVAGRSAPPFVLGHHQYLPLGDDGTRRRYQEEEPCPPPAADGGGGNVFAFLTFGVVTVNALMNAVANANNNNHNNNNNNNDNNNNVNNENVSSNLDSNTNDNTISTGRSLLRRCLCREASTPAPPRHQLLRAIWHWLLAGRARTQREYKG